MLMEDEWAERRRGGKRPTVGAGYTAEDAASFYTTEDATSIYVTEN
jgi:hypothetical protein